MRSTAFISPLLVPPFNKCKWKSKLNVSLSQIYEVGMSSSSTSFTWYFFSFHFGSPFFSSQAGGHVTNMASSFLPNHHFLNFVEWVICLTSPLFVSFCYKYSKWQCHSFGKYFDHVLLYDVISHKCWNHFGKYPVFWNFWPHRNLLKLRKCIRHNSFF